MKQALFALLLPLAGFGQTIHYEDDQILYKGSVNLALYSQDQIMSRLQNALPLAAKKSTDSIFIQPGDTSLTATGQIKLKTPYHLIRRINFALQLKPKEGGYDYKVDSVSLIEGRRAWKITVTPAAKLLEGLEETGMVEIETEILLNEIDLRIQMLLKLLENEMRVPAIDQNKSALTTSGNSVTASQ